MDFMTPASPRPQRILVRATNWLGDTIMCLPALQRLRAEHPKAHIAVLGLPWLKDLYTGERFCDEVFAYPSPRGARAIEAKWRLAQHLRAQRFDTALLLQNAFEAAAFAVLCGIPNRIGYRRDARGWLLTNAVPMPAMKGVHERFYYLELLRRAGLIHEFPSDAPILLEHAAELRARGRAVLTAATIGVCPGAAFGSAKRWYPDRFAAVAAQLHRERGALIALFGTPEEATIAGEVERLLLAQSIPVRNFAARTSMGEFLSLAAACDLMLTNDSGAMHVAYAVGTPSVTVFGSTDHIGTGPVGPRARIVREPVDCAPCKLRECPIDHRCMTRVPSETVAQVALELLK
jgi:heptosyltransferase-2